MAVAAEVDERPGKEPVLHGVVDIDDPLLLAPPSVADPRPDWIRALAVKAGEPVAGTTESMARCILDSLAPAYRRSLRTATEMAGVDVFHIVDS